MSMIGTKINCGRINETSPDIYGIILNKYKVDDTEYYIVDIGTQYVRKSCAECNVSSHPITGYGYKKANPVNNYTEND